MSAIPYIELPLFQGHRKHDAETSVMAGIRAARSGTHVVRAVIDVMNDGVGRTDEEIWLEMRVRNYEFSTDATRHARKALMSCEPKVLFATGERKKTARGGTSHVHQMVTRYQGIPASDWKLRRR